MVCDTQYGVTRVRRRSPRDASAGAAARHRRAGVPADPEAPQLRVRTPRGSRAARLRRRRQHPVPAASTAREAGPADERMEHRRVSSAQVLPNERRRNRTRRPALPRLEPAARRLPRTGERIMPATAGNTLTDRYVAATLRSLPERQRPEIERELRASIADAVEDRIEGGTKPKAAE